MPTNISPEWQQMALYALGAALLLMLVSRIPFVGRLVRFLFSLALLGFFLFLLLQQAPYEPTLAQVTERLGLDGQEVVGREVRIRMSPDGHFWAKVRVNGVDRRMLIDSGATVTTLSEGTAKAAKVEAGGNFAPVVLRTANGLAPARTGAVETLRLGTIEASGLKVVVTPGIGNLDVIGMNFLSKLQSWRVEGRTLVLVPQGAPEGASGGAAAPKGGASGGG
jgi:aspartyl protease family protein